MLRHSFTSSFSRRWHEEHLGRFCKKLVLMLLVLWVIDTLFLIFRYPDINVMATAAEQKGAMVDALDAPALEGVDVLFIGSSHTQFGVNPAAIFKASGLKAFNAGIGGQVWPDLHYKILHRLLEKSKPKIVVYGVDNYFLESMPRNHFAGVDPGRDLLYFSNLFKYKGGVSRFIREIPSYGFVLPFMRKAEMNLREFRYFNGYKLHEDGWVEGDGQTILGRGAEASRRNPAFAPRDESIDGLIDIVNETKRLNIKLVLLQIPETVVALATLRRKNAEYEKFMIDFADRHKVWFLNFNSIGRFPVDEQRLFLDNTHLNSAGANLFSTQLGTELKAVAATEEPARATPVFNNDMPLLARGLVKVAIEVDTPALKEALACREIQLSNAWGVFATAHLSNRIWFYAQVDPPLSSRSIFRALKKRHSWGGVVTAEGTDYRIVWASETKRGSGVRMEYAFPKGTEHDIQVTLDCFLLHPASGRIAVRLSNPSTKFDARIGEYVVNGPRGRLRFSLPLEPKVLSNFD